MLTPMGVLTVQTITVRDGHLSHDRTLVKPLQHEPALGLLVVPVATLDNDLQPKMMPMVLQYVYFRYRIVEPAVHSVRQNTNIKIYLQSANEGVVDLTMANPPIAPDYDKYHNSTLSLVCTGLR